VPPGPGWESVVMRGRRDEEQRLPGPAPVPRPAGKLGEYFSCWNRVTVVQQRCHFGFRSKPSAHFPLLAKRRVTAASPHQV